MGVQRSDGGARAGGGAGGGPTYPPPPPGGLSPVLERNIRALQLRRQREEKEATAEERLAEAIRRTVTGLTSPTFTYTTAMQAEDFPEGYPASAFVVYQISAQVGRGFAARFDFPDAPQLTTLGETIAEGQAGGGTSNFPANTVMAQRYTALAGRVVSASAYLGGGSGDMQIGI